MLQFCNLIWREFMSRRLEDSDQTTSSIPSNGHRGYTQKTPTRPQAPYLAKDTEDIPSKTPAMNPTRMPINFLHSRKASREKCHNAQFSKMRSIWKLLKETFWSQQQPMTVKRSWMEITNLKITVTVKNSLNRRNLFHVQCFQQGTPK